MAELTTTGGFQYTFKPEAVLGLTDHDGATAVTCVYGVTAGVVKIAEGVAEFLIRIGMAGNFAQLTRANGAPIWFNAGAVGGIRAPLPNEYAAAVRSVISAGSFVQGVAVDQAAAKARINAHGGKL